MCKIQIFNTGYTDYWCRPIYLSKDKKQMFIDTNMDDLNPDIHWVDKKPPKSLREIHWNPEAYEPVCRPKNVEIITPKNNRSLKWD